MDQELREKIALAVFVALMAFVVGVFIGYLDIGHSWNSAATSIDDQSGDMEDYTCIVYRGTAVPSSQEGASSAVSIVSVVGEYRSKGASVLRVDTLHPEKYTSEDILYAQGKRFGVFYVPQGATLGDIIGQAEFFAEHEVDYVVCVAEDSALLQYESYGIDVVICLNYESWIRGGTTVNDCYFVNVPSTGRVGAVFFSPDDIISSKDISE